MRDLTPEELIDNWERNNLELQRAIIAAGGLTHVLSEVSVRRFLIKLAQNNITLSAEYKELK